MQQIGMVHQARFHEARKRGESSNTVGAHWEAAQTYLLGSLRLCPDDALPDLAPIHAQLGILYNDAGQLNLAREQYEQAAQCSEKAGDRFQAVRVRLNIALMYLEAPATSSEASTTKTNLQRARDYAEAALRDFKHYSGRAVEQEARAQRILDRINEALAT